LRIDRTAARPFVVGFVGALAAVVLIGLAIHLYLDHQNLHTMLNFLNQHAAKIAGLSAGK
jgi:hypothetical protein